jgi:hypothetical protein
MSNINVAGVPCAPMTTGKVFYVDLSSGSDSSKGTNASYPLRTITQALTKCVSGRGDIIVVSGKAQLTAKISINKDNVSIIGLGPDSPMGGETRLSGGEHDILSVEADKVRIENIRLQCLGNATDSAAIAIVGGDDKVAYQTTIRNVHIMLDHAASKGIRINTGSQLARSIVENVRMDADQASYGIGGSGSSSFNIIKDCYFSGPFTSAITLDTSAKDIIVGVKAIGETASVNVIGTLSMVTECRTSVAISGTALAGDNTTVA